MAQCTLPEWARQTFGSSSIRGDHCCPQAGNENHHQAQQPIIDYKCADLQADVTAAQLPAGSHLQSGWEQAQSLRELSSMHCFGRGSVQNRSRPAEIDRTLSSEPANAYRHTFTAITHASLSRAKASMLNHGFRGTYHRWQAVANHR